MKLQKLFDDEEAVSPVIGVILMVAITVILAAVIGTFVLGLGEQVQESTPQASFSCSNMDPADTALEITHEGGDSIEKANLKGSPTLINGSSYPFSAGDVADTNELIWQSTKSDKTSILKQC